MTRMTAAQIWRFLDEARFGRIATHDHERGETSLTPLFFARRNGRIYFATQPGRKLDLLRRYPAGVGLQCDRAVGDTWISVFVWGRYRDVRPGPEYARATLALAGKYGTNYLAQIAEQARKALRGGPREIVRTIRGATTGCIDLERIGGRVWSDGGL